MKNRPISHPLNVWIALILVYLIWGSTYLAIRFAIASIPPFLMAGMRFLISGIFLYLFMRWKGEKRPSLSHWKSAVIIGFFLILVANGGVSWAEQKVSSGMAALLVGTVPLWMVFLEWLLKKGTRPGISSWIGVLLGFSGIALLVFSKAGSGNLETSPLWALLLVATSAAWSYGSLYARSAPLPASPLLATSLEMITGGVLQLITGFLLGEPAHFHLSQITLSSGEAWIYLTFIGSLVGFTSYIWVLQKSTPELASTYAFVNPVIAVFLGWLLAGEALTPSLFVATALIVAAVILITLSPGKKARK